MRHRVFVVKGLLCFAFVFTHQLRHAADPHRIDPGDVYQLRRVEVSQLLQVVDDSDGSGLQVEALHARRRAHGLTSAELVRHEGCNPDYPDAGA